MDNPQVDREAGLDISTGHGADSFFGPPQSARDPWAVDCFITLMDTLINYESVRYPVPRAEVAPQNLPESFETADLQPETKASAEDIQLEDEELVKEFSVFDKWLLTEKNTGFVADWLSWHAATPRLRSAIRRQFQEAEEGASRPVDRKFLAFDELSTRSGISSNGLRAVFDGVIRTIQYGRILGTETDFYTHPFRFVAPVTKNPYRYENLPSWGRYFVHCIRRGWLDQHRRDVGWFIHMATAIRGLSKDEGTRWDNWKNLDDEQGKAALLSIAAAMELPAEMKEATLRSLDQGVDLIGGADTARTSVGLPPSILVQVGVVLAKVAVKHAARTPARLGEVRWLARHIRLPGILREWQDKPAASRESS